MNELSEELRAHLQEVGDDIDGVLSEVTALSGAADVFIKDTCKNLIFFGKSLALWEDLMAIKIPPAEEITPDIIRSLHVQLANKEQTASHFYEEARAAHTLSVGSLAVKRADLTTALITDYVMRGQNTPPATVMEKMVDGFVKKLNNVALVNKAIKDFWYGKLQTLEKVGKHLDKIGMSIALEMKHLERERND